MPYQLHCCPPLLIKLELELPITGAELLEREELMVGTLEGAAELTEAPEQILPVNVGISAVPPRLSTWKPKVALWPGGKAPFQPRFDAV